MKKGLKFTKKQLEGLYWNKKLSLSQIGKQFYCQGTNILYWLKKFGIKRRPAYFRKVDIPKRVLENLYLNKKMSSIKIAEKLDNVVNARTIRKKLKKFGIPTRPLSESLTKKFKKPFTGDLGEKAYLLGLRAGDFYAQRVKKSIRVQTTTTHLAQIDLSKNAFRNYGEICVYLSKNESREDEWFVYIDLHPSFEFLLTKPIEILKWILNIDKYFFQFLAAYIDCEGAWKVQKSHQAYARFIFKIRTGDPKILRQIKEKLERLNFHPYLYLDRKKGTESSYGLYNRDIFDLTINRKKEIISLIKRLLPLSKHNEKVRRMKFILKFRDEKWNTLEKPWNKLRKEIENELLKNQTNKLLKQRSNNKAYD